jgi:hypothetical protein
MKYRDPGLGFSSRYFHRLPTEFWMILGWHDLIEVNFELSRKRRDPISNSEQGAVGTRQVDMRIAATIMAAISNSVIHCWGSAESRRTPDANSENTDLHENLRDDSKAIELQAP